MASPLSSFSAAEILAELERRMYCRTRPESRTILVGPPGCGKGTQSPKLVEDFCVCHLATGDMLRAAVAAGTEMGREAQKIMQAGGLVGDDVVVGIIKETLSTRRDCERGFVLDGFPRTVPQAEKLEQLLAEQGKAIDSVVEFAVDDAVLTERIAGRWIHKASGRSYHTKFHPPKVAGKDDETGEPLSQRPDDNVETLGARLRSYHEQTTPVLGFYKAKGKLRTLNADQPSATVWGELKSIVERDATKLA